jgi:hypothetical protein
VRRGDREAAWTTAGSAGGPQPRALPHHPGPPVTCGTAFRAFLRVISRLTGDRAHGYKLAAAAALSDLTVALQAAIPGLTGEDCRDIVAATTALAANFWQTANPSAALYEQDPQLAHARIDFTPRLRQPRRGEEAG